MKTILILGASGLLGKNLTDKLQDSPYTLLTHSRNSDTDYKFDLSNASLVRNNLNRIKPDIIFNLAANTNVDICEGNKHMAYSDNVTSVQNISSWLNNSPANCRLIHISTDQLYDGRGPHKEIDSKAMNYYAHSKLLSEAPVLNSKGLVLRTNFFGKSNVKERLSFSDWIYSALVEKTKITVFDDIYFSPLSMETLTKLLSELVVSDLIGLYNLGSNNGMSKASFAYKFAMYLGMNSSNISVGSQESSSLLAYRPKDMRMCCKKFEEDFKLDLPNLEEEIKKVAGEYK